MNSDSEKPDDHQVVTIEDELKSWPSNVHSNVAEAEMLGRSERQKQTQQAARRRRIIAGILVLSAGLLVVIPLIVYFSRTSSVASNGSRAIQPAELQNAQVKVGTTENAEDYKRTEATVTFDEKEILRVVQYDFYASKFIVDNTALRDKPAIIKHFTSLHEQLKDSWVIIFASASLEGDEDHNLDLCRCRLYAVEALLNDEAGVKARGYWGILAGEYKINLANIESGRREEEEDRIAKDRGTKWLSEQRRLIVVTIREIAPLTSEARELVPLIVANKINENKMFPQDYDAPNSAPFLLKSQNTNSNESTNRSSKR